MNALLKKEIRVLLPGFILACVATFSLLAVQPDATSPVGWIWFLPSVICPALVVMMALNSFGVEVTSGTFSSLLAQPISRLKIWQTKIVLLAIALLTVSVLWFGMLCLHAAAAARGEETDLNDLFAGVSLFILAIFSGSLWTVLLLRQVAAAFWFTLLVPGILSVVLEGLLAGADDHFREGMVVAVLGIYSLAGLFFARWLFLRAQDLQWTGGSIVLPEIRGFAGFKEAAASARRWRPHAALWLKELQLHQSQYVIAFVLVVLHLGVLAVREYHDLRNSRDLQFVLEIFWGIWLVMPVLVGCTAVAEERKLGTLEGQLCLPVKRRQQFAIKLAVVLFLSSFFGIALPLLLEGTRILPGISLGNLALNDGVQLTPAQIFLWHSLEMFSRSLPGLIFVSMVALMGLVSFYVSTLSRNTLQSLAPAVLGLTAMFFLLLSATLAGKYGYHLLWRGPLPYFIALPLFLLVLLLLAFENFNQPRIGWPTGRRNLLGLSSALALGIVLTSAIYHRTWEKLTPFEPSHGPARLRLSDAARLDTVMDTVNVRLPGGKIWLAQYDHPAYSFARLLNNVKAKLNAATIARDSNWLVLKCTSTEVVGIKTDGTLWVSGTNRESSDRYRYPTAMLADDLQHVIQVGTDTHWASLVAYGRRVFLVKDDGTLWQWGTTNFDERHQAWPGLRTFAPQRLGTDSDWAKISQDNYYQLFLRKTDGSLWTWPGNWTGGRSLLTLDPGFTFSAVDILKHMEFRSWTQISFGLGFRVGVRSDGTFRVWADERLATGYHGNYEWFPTDKPIGDGTNWVAVAGNGEKIVTLKDDGSLWLWNFSYDYRHGWDLSAIEAQIQNARPVRLGTHSDWIAISGSGFSICALAADGSLWHWQLEDYVYQFDHNNPEPIGPLLDFSHKPQFLANIFAEHN